MAENKANDRPDVKHSVRAQLLIQYGWVFGVAAVTRRWLWALQAMHIIT